LARAGAAAAGEEPRRLWREGREVGEWTVAGFVGRGGSAEVYCARHRRLGTEGVLKVLWREGEGPRERFVRETRFLMEGPGTAFPTFYGSGVEEGRPWMAMELLEDYPLPKSDAGVAAYLLDVARGVEELHRRGWVHRDLKPRNILRRASDGHAVLIDFGLLKRTGENAAAVTAAGRASPSVVDGREVGVGTPGYAAPEQFAGGAATPASDVHALGMLADECFGGKPPRAWERIIRRATGSLPRQRYADAAAMARAIRRRHWARNLGYAGLALLAAAGMVAVLWAGRGAIPSKEERIRNAAVRKAGKGDQKDIIGGIIGDMVPMSDPFDEQATWLIARHEVTQAQWDALMEENPSRFKGEDLPVDNVTIIECLEFISRLNRTSAVRAAGLVFRLPTRTEWWRSAVDEPGRLDAIGYLPCNTQEEWVRDWFDNGWFRDNSGGTTHPVGQKEPTKAGIHDMWGNVAEPVGPPWPAFAASDEEGFFRHIVDGEGNPKLVFRCISCMGSSIRKNNPVGDGIWDIGGDFKLLSDEAKSFFDGMIVLDDACDSLSSDDPRRDTDQGEIVGLRLAADKLAEPVP